jgi:hypothetical protein
MAQVLVNTFSLVVFFSPLNFVVIFLLDLGPIEYQKNFEKKRFASIRISNNNDRQISRDIRPWLTINVTNKMIYDRLTT